MVTRVESDIGASASRNLVDTVGAPFPAHDEIHVATVNVRLNRYAFTTPDPQKPYAERPWSERKTRLVDALLSTGQLDIVGFQEVLYDQLQDLIGLLPGYSHVGVGRDDGKQAGEYSPIFFDNRKYEVVKWSTIWLSPTPDVPGSKGWDAALPRIATLLTLRQRGRGSKSELVHTVNTHYDHLGVKARAQSSLLIRSQIWRWVKRVEEELKCEKEGCVLLFGDFNSPPEEEGYKNITSLHPLPSGQPSFTFLDSFNHLVVRSYRGNTGARTQSGYPLQTGPYGPVDTYTDFAPPGSRDAKRIDFIMLATAVNRITGPAANRRSNRDSGQTAEVDTNGKQDKPGAGRGGWHVTRYACLDNYVQGDSLGWRGRWSDHRAVRVTLRRQALQN